MGNKTDATMTEVAPYKLKLKPRECEICGGKYIPTGTKQRFCPACREGKKRNLAYELAKNPGEVISYKIESPETPEAGMQQPEVPEEITRQVIETPEQNRWYECRIRRGDSIMMDAKISPEIWAMMLEAIK